jgi:RHH-type rel operon transcriptional repressor/antitoxin RelB
MYKTVKPTTFTLPLTLLEELDGLSKELGKKKTAIVTEALEMYMDMNDLKEAEKRLEDKSVSAEAFFEDLGA